MQGKGGREEGEEEEEMKDGEVLIQIAFPPPLSLPCLASPIAHVPPCSSMFLHVRSVHTSGHLCLAINFCILFPAIARTSCLPSAAFAWSAGHVCVRSATHASEGRPSNRRSETCGSWRGQKEGEVHLFTLFSLLLSLSLSLSLLCYFFTMLHWHTYIGSWEGWFALVLLFSLPSSLSLSFPLCLVFILNFNIIRMPGCPRV